MKSIIVLLLSFIMCSLIYSQDSTKSSEYALSFGVRDNFTVGKFIMDIAVKKILDNSHHLRLFLSPNFESYKNDESTTENNFTNEKNSINYSLGIGADYLWILIKNEDIDFFGGTGLAFVYGRRNIKETSYPNGNKITSETAGPTLDLVIRGTVGVEWMVSKKIGIHSEYMFLGSYLWSKSEYKSSYNDVNNPTVTRTTSGMSLDSQVLFGISIYF